MVFKDLDELYKYVENEIAASLKNDVAPKIKEIESRHVQEDVYDVYNIVDGKWQPPYYSRRKDKGGLSDPNNMVEVVEIVNGNIILSITNETRGKDQTDLYVAPLVEYGQGSGNGSYQYPYNSYGTAYQFLEPRPFTEEAIKEISENDIHRKVLLESLISKGFTFK